MRLIVKSLRFVYCIFIAMIFMAGPGFGQHHGNSRLASDTTDEIERRRAIVNAFLADSNAEKASRSIDKAVIPMDDVPVATDSITRLIQTRAWRNYFDYKNFGYEHRKRLFNWQLISSKIIFFVVIGLVISGVYFAGLQFFHSIKMSKKGESMEKMMNTELIASGKEIRVSSPVLGVIILVLSFLFFFLYLKFVYPIQETF